MSLPPHKARNLTPKHLVGIERDRLYNRILLWGTIAVVAVVIGLVGYAIARESLIIPNETVAVVEGKKITGHQFQARTKINRTRLINQYVQYYQTMQMFGGDSTFQQQAYMQMIQLQYSLTPEVVGESSINELVDDELLKLEAAELGIEVSQDQVDEQLRNLFQYFPNGTPTSPATNTPAVFSTLSAEQLAIVSPTPTRTAQPSPSATSAFTPTAAATSAEPAATQAPTLTPFPTSTPITQEGYEGMLTDYYASQLEDLGLTEEDIREIVYMGLLRQAVMDYLAKDVPHVEEQVWARHILVATEGEAKTVLTRLQSGQDWAAIAAEVSTDTSNSAQGGDLGWFSHDTMVEPFANAAFDMEIGEISEPIQSDFGWHIIQVLGHEDRPLLGTAFDQRVQAAYDAFVLTLRDKYDWEIFDNWQSITPNKPSIPPLQ
jgi:hypothetical protein